MKKTLIASLLISLLIAPGFAQTDAQTQPMPGRGMMMDYYGMMNRQGMMMGQGMMNCPMLGMMGQPRTEGRIAFLKAELKITNDQEQAWAAYADVLRNMSQAMANQMQDMMGQSKMGPGMMGQGAMGPGMMGQGAMGQGIRAMSAPEVLELRIQMMESMISNLKSLQSVTSDLYVALDDSQKTTADELLSMPCGMMGPM